MLLKWFSFQHVLSWPFLGWISVPRLKICEEVSLLITLLLNLMLLNGHIVTVLISWHQLSATVLVQSQFTSNSTSQVPQSRTALCQSVQLLKAKWHKWPKLQVYVSTKNNCKWSPVGFIFAPKELSNELLLSVCMTHLNRMLHQH